MNSLQRFPIILLAGAVALLAANCAQAQSPGPKELRPSKGKEQRAPLAGAKAGLKQGRQVKSGRETYREVGEVRVVRQPHPKGMAAEVLAEQGIEAAEVVSTKGDLVFYVPRAGVESVPQAVGDGQEARRVVLNERTGQLAAVLGTIEVQLAVPGSARALARDFGLVLKRDFPHLRAAFLQVNPGQDPFDMADALRADPRVQSADAEVLENPAIPH